MNVEGSMMTLCGQLDCHCREQFPGELAELYMTGPNIEVK
jgi:hypothetical protein